MVRCPNRQVSVGHVGKCSFKCYEFFGGPNFNPFWAICVEISESFQRIKATMRERFTCIVDPSLKHVPRNSLVHPHSFALSFQDLGF